MARVTEIDSASSHPFRVVILASGSGTLAEALMTEPGANYQVVGVVTDCDCYCLTRASNAGVPHHTVAFRGGDEREAWNTDLARAVRSFHPDLVVSAGFMRILSPGFLEQCGCAIINTHPALLPSFPGAHAVRDALAYGVKITGSTVHYVDAGVDTGPIIAQRAVEVREGDTEESLHERIKVEERRNVVAVVRDLAGRRRAEGQHD